MENKYRLLSYSLDMDTATYGGDKPFTIEKDRDVSKGDSCNTFILNLPNHFGTHIECPNHFFNTGKKICRYKAEDFIFLRPVLLDCPKSANQLISEEDIKKYSNRFFLKKADLLLLRTGFYKYRGAYKYSTENPGISPQAARFIRMELENIRCVGIDTISVSSYQNRELGRQTHRIFFSDSFKKEPIRLIEDMNLSGKIEGLKKVYVFPLFVRGIDSSSCTVLGVFGKR